MRVVGLLGIFNCLSTTRWVFLLLIFGVVTLEFLCIPVDNMLIAEFSLWSLSIIRARKEKP
jgi:hypothetical protein